MNGKSQCDAPVNPETTWHKIKNWPSAVLAELAIRIQGEIHKRAEEARKKRGEAPNGPANPAPY